MWWWRYSGSGIAVAVTVAVVVVVVVAGREPEACVHVNVFMCIHLPRYVPVFEHMSSATLHVRK